MFSISVFILIWAKWFVILCVFVISVFTYMTIEFLFIFISVSGHNFALATSWNKNTNFSSNLKKKTIFNGFNFTANVVY